jgi:histidine ammonia-lyase
MTTPSEFVGRLVATAAELALFFAGESEERMLAALSQTRENLATELSDQFGADTAASIADAFVAAVAGRRREMGEPVPVAN